MKAPLLQQIEPLRLKALHWYDARSVRERWLLAAGAITLLIALFVVLVWAPLMSLRAEARAEMAAYDRAIAGIEAAGSALAADPAQTDMPLETALTSSAESAGIDIARLDPVDGGAEIVLENAEFARTLSWIDTLSRRYAIRVTELSMERLTTPGMVSARIGFAR